MTEGLEELKAFSVTSLAEWLHEETPRADLNFKSVDNTFLPDDWNYQQSLIMIGSPFVLAFILTLLQRLVRCCCKACCKGGNRISNSFKEQKPHPTRWVCIFVFVMLAITGGVAFGYFANFQVQNGMMALKDAVIDLDELISSSADEIDSVAVTLRQIDLDAQSLKASIVLAASSVDTSAVESTLDAVSAEVLPAADDVEEGTKEVRDVELDDKVDLLETIEHNRWLAQMMFLALLLIPYVLVLEGLVCKSRGMLYCVPITALIVAVIGWLVVAVETPLVVALADLCVDPTGYVTQRAPGIDGSTLEYVRYFTICEGEPNPLDGEIDSAQEAIQTSQAEITSLWSELQDLRPAMSDANYTAIRSDYWQLGNTTDDLADEVHRIEQVVFVCNSAHNIYVDAMTAVCGDALSGLAKLDAVQAGMCALMWLAIACASTLYAYHKSGHLNETFRSSRRMDFLSEGGGAYDDDGALPPPPPIGGKRAKKKRTPIVDPL